MGFRSLRALVSCIMFHNMCRDVASVPENAGRAKLTFFFSSIYCRLYPNFSSPLCLPLLPQIPANRPNYHISHYDDTSSSSLLDLIVHCVEITILFLFHKGPFSTCPHPSPVHFSVSINCYINCSFTLLRYHLFSWNLCFSQFLPGSIIARTISSDKTFCRSAS